MRTGIDRGTLGWVAISCGRRGGALAESGVGSAGSESGRRGVAGARAEGAGRMCG